MINLSEFSRLTTELYQLLVIGNNLRSASSAFKAVPEIVAVIESILAMLDKKTNELTKKRASLLQEVTAYIDRCKKSRVRLYMRLHYLHGLQYAEIAAIFGISADAIRQRVPIHIKGLALDRPEHVENSPLSIKLITEYRKLIADIAERKFLLEILEATEEVNRPLCDISSEKCRLCKEIIKLRSKQAACRPVVESLIAGIDRVDTQEYAKLFFMEGLSWREVAEKTQAHSEIAVQANVNLYLRTRLRVEDKQEKAQT